MPNSGLTAAFVKHVRKPGKYFDQHGLILRVRPTGSKQWIWRGTVRGRRRDLGLGGFPYTSLREARLKAFEYRKIARGGEDPHGHDRQVPTFQEAAEKVIAIHRAGWRPGSKSESQWRASLRDYAMPHFADKTVDEITTADVMAALVPIWSSKAETARRVRHRIGAVMKWAIAKGYRPDNPCGEVLGAALPKQNGRVRHHRALPHRGVAAALDTVQASGAATTTKLAFRFLVLTAGRSAEVRNAIWEEIDSRHAIWTVSAERMKAGRRHRVPLSRAALDVLASAKRFRTASGLVFPSPVRTGALSAVTLAKLLRDLRIEAVPHGFRTSFRMWCGDTGVAREVAEAALAHTVRNPVEAAYARGDLFGRRREVMEAWARYVMRADDNG